MSECRTTRDLGDKLVRADAHQALRRAQDFGGPAERAAWVATWGDALADLLASPSAARDEDDDLWS